MSEHILVIDTETTGLDEEVDEVVQVCIRHGLDPQAETHLWEVKPIHKIPAEATATHGITDEATRDWPSFGQVADVVKTHIERGDVIVGYNPDFDVAMLKAEFRRSSCEVRWPPLLVCCKRLWDINEPRPPRKLQDAFRKFVDPTGFEGAHGALADTVATARVLAAQLALWKLQETPWHLLDPERATWWGPSRHAVWREGDLVANFGRQKDQVWATIDNGFQRWILNKDFPAHIRALAQQTMRLRSSVKETKDRVIALNTWAMEAARQRGWI